MSHDEADRALRDAMPGRNTPVGLAMRTRKNLEYILAAREDRGADVHVVTQVVLALLGLVVFPYEDAKKRRSSPPLLAGEPRLSTSGSWAVSVDRIANSAKWREPALPLNQGDLLTNLRHAIAHGNVLFSGNSRSLDDVWLEFTNNDFGNGRQWVMQIGGPDLLAFCRNLLLD